MLATFYTHGIKNSKIHIKIFDSLLSDKKAIITPLLYIELFKIYFLIQNLIKETNQIKKQSVNFNYYESKNYFILSKEYIRIFTMFSRKLQKIKRNFLISKILNKTSFLIENVKDLQVILSNRLGYISAESFTQPEINEIKKIADFWEDSEDDDMMVFDIMNVPQK